MTPPLDAVGIDDAEHAHMPVHPDRRAYDQRDADHARVAFDGHTTGQAGNVCPSMKLVGKPGAGNRHAWLD
jgi:cytochrome c5